MKVFKSKKAKGILGVVVALAVAVAAIAYWTAGGSGSGSASVAGSNGAITLSGTVTGDLVPGGSAPVSLKASNTGSSSLRVGSVSGTVKVDAAHKTAGCDEADFHFGNVTENQRIDGNATNVALTNGGSVSMDDTSAD